MRIARRVGLGVLLVLVAYGLLAGWQAYQVQKDLRAAEDAVNRLDASLKGDDLTTRNQAAKEFTDHAGAAADRTDGVVWGIAEHVPVLGDDVAAVGSVSRSLDTLASGAVQPLLLTVDTLDGVTQGGRIDVDKLETVREPVATARQATADARQDIAGLDPSDFVGPVRTRLEEYVDRLGDLSDGLDAGDEALEIVPGVLGADGPREYLLVFQNNAEIRATGGIPGSWAQIHAEAGELRIVRQGSSASFQDVRSTPVPITEAEDAVYNDIFGKFWQDATFTPDWPRASDLMRQHWEKLYAPATLDGVISLDPVGMSYLMAGTGPVQVGEVTLDPGSVVDQLLSQPYLTLDPAAQDEFFAEAARSVFTTLTGNIVSPLDLVRGVDKAVKQRRFLFTSFDPDEAEALEGTGVVGDVPDDDGSTPRVVIALNDGTASKMSYYLRYSASVEATGCEGGTQTLAGRLELNQTIPADQAEQLPDVVSGTGDIGIPKGMQLVVVRLHTPTGGTVSDIKVADQKVDVEAVDLDGRGVVTLIAQLDGSGPTEVTWTMTTGAGQQGDGTLQVTPGIEPESQDSEFPSAC